MLELDYLDQISGFWTDSELDVDDRQNNDHAAYNTRRERGNRRFTTVVDLFIEKNRTNPFAIPWDWAAPAF